MRVRHTVNPIISEDADGTSILLGLSDVTAETILDGFQSQGNDVRDLLQSGGEFAVPLGGPTVIHGFWLRATGDFDLRINNSAQAFQVRRGSTGTGGAVFANAKVLMECITTALHVTPIQDLRLFWAVWGDPTP